MKKVAIIGAGISGLATAHFLKSKYDVTLFERDSQPGGLIKCQRINGNLFHSCGGHVFNSKRKDVLDWFWSHFNREDEFSKAERNSCVFIDKDTDSYDIIPYPIENHVYLFDEDIQKQFYNDLIEIDRIKGLDAKFTDYENFGDFLRWRFGNTLYGLYFEPYNKKIWRRDLSTVPMSWMEGKLPMPTTQEMRENNANRVEEKAFVHSSFWYEKYGGSQYIADKLAQGLNIVYDADVNSIVKVGRQWQVCDEMFDKVVYCGSIKEMLHAIEGLNLTQYEKEVEALEYHGTTAVFCEIDSNPYSWIYLPSARHESHRIICTGNFSQSNNHKLPSNRITATIEFTDYISKEEILRQLNKIPLHPLYITHKFNPCTYPIQNASTRSLVSSIKAFLAPYGFYSTGRFADWEYYNMDVAIGAAMNLSKNI